MDYFLIRRTELDLKVFYDEKGPLQGINWAGVIAVIVGAVAALMFVTVSWYASLLPAGITYYLLMKHMPSAQRFRQG